MTKIFPKFGRKTAADEIIHQIHKLREHGKLKDIDPREEAEIAEAIRSKFPNDRYIETHKLYEEVFKPLGYKDGDLLDSKEIEEVGKSVGLRNEDMNSFRSKHSLPED